MSPGHHPVAADAIVSARAEHIAHATWHVHDKCGYSSSPADSNVSPISSTRTVLHAWLLASIARHCISPLSV